MKPFTIRQIIEATQGELLGGVIDLSDMVITGVSTDTRAINKGDLFIPLVGENFDGHYFLDVAAEKGAAAVLIHRDDANWLPELFPKVATIKVADTLKALQDLASFRRSQFNIPIVAVTGSNGKTTTKDMIALVLSQRYNVLKTEGNLNNEIGLPLTLLKLEDSHEVAVVEMGMSALGEIHKLAGIAKPTIAVITNIGMSHIQYLGTKENILKAKLEILDFLTPEDKVILNGDDELLGKVRNEFSFKVEYYGTGERARIRGENIEPLGEKGVFYTLKIGEKTCDIIIPLPGRHNVYNSLAAAAVGDLLGIGLMDIAGTLKDFHPGDMRLNILKTDFGIKVIDDVYNASPDSVKASVEILGDLKGRRKIAILGDMRELGDCSKKCHLDIGRTVAKKGIDILITVGDDSGYIDKGAYDSGMDAQDIIHFNCNKDVIIKLGTMLESGDTILVKGSRTMKMEEIVEYLKDWEDRQ